MSPLSRWAGSRPSIQTCPRSLTSTSWRIWSISVAKIPIDRSRARSVSFPEEKAIGDSVVKRRGKSQRSEGAGHLFQGRSRRIAFFWHPDLDLGRELIPGKFDQVLSLGSDHEIFSGVGTVSPSKPFLCDNLP